MWTFGKYGFTSAVAYDPKKDWAKDSPFKKIVKESDTHILVRARIEADLEDVRDRVLPSMQIVEQPSADYSFRAVIPRSLFKKYLALMVDAIDYDSHFKEVAEKHGHGVKGADRHSAMMKVWTAMAALQPHTPYSGAYSSGGWWNDDDSSGYTGKGSGYGSTYSGGGKSTTPVTTSGKVATPKGSGPISKGAKDMETFLDDYVDSNGELTYRSGNGPRTGFKVQDKVEGYFGTGVVTHVRESSRGGADTVTVKPDEKNKKVANFLSNFLVPAGLAEKYAMAFTYGDDEDGIEIVLEGDVLDDSLTGEDGLPLLTMEEVYDIIHDQKYDLTEFSPEDFRLFDDHAFELVTRLMEAHGTEATVSHDDLNKVYDEIRWEISTPEFKAAWIKKGDEVPAKHEAEAIKIVLEDVTS